MYTLLVIDDEVDICQCVEDTFREEGPGYFVLKANNGLEGLELVKRYKPDVILLDMQLEPSLDGMKVLKKIKEIHPKGKVAILTGVEENKKEAFELCADAYALKPFTPPELLSLVKELLREKKGV